MALPLTAAVVSFRVRARVQVDRLVIGSYWRTYTFQFSALESVAVAEYGGLWSMGQPADIIGIVQIDFYEKHRSYEIPVPATICIAPSGRRIVRELNALIDDFTPPT